MIFEDEKDYHLTRARAEMDLAYRAPEASAAQAHMKLSALHMARIKALDPTNAGPAVEAPGLGVH